jgi:hypothetical protein
MIGAAKRFSELMNDLLLRREIAGGPLSQDEESAVAAELERCWWEMTDEEQATSEALFSSARPPGAPVRIDQLDEVVEQGARTPPRRKAA